MIISAFRQELSRSRLNILQGWSGAVEARYFIVALKELYFDLVRDNQSHFTRDDLWAIKYLDLQYAQAISEAVDEDASGFVTVTEMNNFMRNKPKDWRCDSCLSCYVCY